MNEAIQTYEAAAKTEKLFELDEAFVKKFEGKQPEWGPLGYVTYKRTYARDIGEGKTEEYWQTTIRVIEGSYTIQKQHCLKNRLPWNEERKHRNQHKQCSS